MTNTSGNGKYSAEQMIEAIHKSKGLLSVAARNLGCNRSTVYTYMKRYATVAQAVEDARENMTDFVEGKLYEKVQAGDTTAIIFYLKTQAKKRGYIERQDVNLGGGIKIEITENVTSDLA